MSPKTTEEILSQTLRYQFAVSFICDSMSIKLLLLLHTVSSRRVQGVLMMLHVSWVSKEENVEDMKCVKLDLEINKTSVQPLAW